MSFSLKVVPPAEGCAACNEPGTELSFTDYSFLLNLRQADSVTNLTNDKEPAEETISGGNLHFHGRMRDFTPVVIRKSDGAEIKRAQKLGHAGLRQSNCDYCHARDGMRYGAPAVINTAPWR